MRLKTIKLEDCSTNLMVLTSFSKMNTPRRDFIVDIMLLFLSVPGRMNFLQFGRYGKSCEQRYRQQFEKEFDFLKFNIETTQNAESGNYIIAFDPSYISKSGNKTPGTDKFWSGVAGAAKWGLEISGMAAVDIDNNTAFHLEAVRTLTHKQIKEKGMSLLHWYANIIIERATKLEKVSRYLVADAYFSKQPFVDKILNETSMHLISRLRNDAHLVYLYKGPRTGNKGRPKQYDGKIDLANIDKEYFDLVLENEDCRFYSAIVYCKALKRKIKLVYQEMKGTKSKSHLLFFSTDLNLGAQTILLYYKSRFQIEFLYRDGKQHTGLNDCQARSENKLDFHFNASLTAINLAKVNHWLDSPKEERGAFSMADIKTMYHNMLMLDRFIDVFAVPAYKLKNNKYI